MQDRLKFRVFDNDDKKMHDVIFLNYENNSVEWYNDNNKKRAAFIGEVPIVQCTGLIDINGKLIYEKDIIKCSYCSEFAIGVIEWVSEELQFALKIEDAFYSIRQKTKFDKIEILGNIYENPFLLSQRQHLLKRLKNLFGEYRQMQMGKDLRPREMEYLLHVESLLNQIRN